MQKNQAAADRNRSLYINILVVVVFLSLIVGFINHLNDNSSDIRYLSLEKLSDTFSASANTAHWQWQAQGRPELIMLSSYANELGKDKKLIETKSQRVAINTQGWPKVEQSVAGCKQLWKLLLDFPLEIDGFDVLVDFYHAEQSLNKRIEPTCRYGLSTGPYFEYKINIGRVVKVEY